MAATGIVRASTRVAMVWPDVAPVQVDVLDLRAEPRHDAELVDQAHFMERLTLLGEHGTWRYVQGEDQYFGWVDFGGPRGPNTYGERYIVAKLLADIRERPEPSATVVARLAVGSAIPQIRGLIDDPDGRRREIEHVDPEGWHEVVAGPQGRGIHGFVSNADLVDVRQLPHRYPTSADLLATAEAFAGVSYLWGGTTALGLDCSGFVQQVYRLNGVALPRDADQQAVLGRRVEEARAGDLFFFGADAVTHVALATGPVEFIHAPMKGGFVERSRLGGERRLLGIRRYLLQASA